MELFLIDAIGPFFRNYEKPRINWSKIPFPHLATEGPQRRIQWDQIAGDLRTFAREATALGYNAVTLDDLAHLALHPLQEPEIQHRIQIYREEFTYLFRLLKNEFGLKIFLTTDVIPVTPAIDSELKSRAQLESYYGELVRQILHDFPELSGLILRIGESDGKDVRDPIRTRLHLRSPREVRKLITRLLPDFEKSGKTLILRTWTVGAHRIGDLIWNEGTLDEVLRGIDSPHFIVSMKYGESDFFRYLPLSRGFFTIPQNKLLELQARREYEGAGEYPSFIGWDCEQFARELRDVKNLAGISVWCQTGGWHRFRRLAFLEDRDIWIRLNVAASIGIFRDRKTAEETLIAYLGETRAHPALELLRHADAAIRHLLYIEDFAKLRLFFRRVRIPPLLHVYWDVIFINHAVRKVLRHFVPDPARALLNGQAAAAKFPHMIALAREAGLPADDIEHMRDVFSLLLLARRYYFLPYDPTLIDRLRSAKKSYKLRWPAHKRQRYRLKLSFLPFHVKRRTLAWTGQVLLRKKHPYRLLDHLLTLHLLGFIFRLFHPRDPRKTPKFLRKSAMGVETLFK
ncbi:MAG: hypothetical protein QM680_03190 [Luteolibacter sp.]